MLKDTSSIQELIAQRDELDRKIREATELLDKHKEFASQVIEMAVSEGILLDQLALMISPNVILKSDTQAETKSDRKRRKMKLYRNPHTNEVIETRGGNHKTLKAWKKEYGNDVVESWLSDNEDSQAENTESEAEAATTLDGQSDSGPQS